MSRFPLYSFLALLLFAMSAEAAKFGGGRSFGYKKPIQYRALNAKPKAAPTSPKTTKPAASQRPRSGMTGLLGGLLAGGLLAALFMGGAFDGITPGDILVLLLIGGAIWWFVRRRRPRPAVAGGADYADDAAPASAAQQRSSLSDGIRIGANVGGSGVKENSVGGETLPPPPPWFEVSGFEQGAVDNFLAVQKAWDAGDTETLKAYCDPACFEAIAEQIRAGENQTEVEQVTAQVIDWDYDNDRFVVSVRFSGLVRENGGPAHGFTEVWHVAKPADGSGDWKIIGVQQL
ncbi:Predicted lipid-binding transport protein, Tim44 family [Sulfurivirga caldicuralii]|uniref:Predicted lipid-binding transport protein, Tim44 family n=1 Tax=Sulfurivirga caldicuralii TaxID=364032 RepID=A0A1N6GE75_9GAMM|nr:TIM44-like domain-containing protein [Sulfurivirga caldicuralii]SIO05879.1 Predicted lipid-binding transport protein, Tim44 family [Sulfurivirga caldicuralii]